MSDKWYIEKARKNDLMEKNSRGCLWQVIASRIYREKNDKRQNQYVWKTVYRENQVCSGKKIQRLAFAGRILPWLNNTNLIKII